MLIRNVNALSVASAHSAHVVIEGGGSHTSLAVVVNGEIVDRTHGGSVNWVQGTTSLSELLIPLVDKAGPPKSLTLAVGAAATNQRAKRTALSLRASQILPSHTRITVTNDVVPLVLLGSPRETTIALIAGTGSGAAGRAQHALWARSGGQEYLLSDQGGGFDIGLRGLKAVVRARDGRGSTTQLEQSAAKWSDGQELFEFVYGAPEQKGIVASFAPLVFDAAAQGDETSNKIVRRAADELAAYVLAVANALRTDFVDSLVLSGSLLNRRPELRQLVLSRIELRLGVGTIQVGTDPLELAARSAALINKEPHLVERMGIAIPAYTTV